MYQLSADRPLPPSLPTPTKGGACGVNWKDFPKTNARWNSVAWSTRAPKLVSAADYTLEVDAVYRPVLASGNYNSALALFAEPHPGLIPINAGSLRTMATVYHAESLPVTDGIPCWDIQGNALAKCCWSAAAVNDPSTCSEQVRCGTTEIAVGLVPTSCSGRYVDVPDVPTWNAMQADVMDLPYFGDATKNIPGTMKPQAVYASKLIVDVDPEANGQARIRGVYSPELLAASCSAAADWNDMLSSLSDRDLGKHVAFDTGVMRDMCERSFVDAKSGRETMNYLACPACLKWADSKHFEDGTSGPGCTTTDSGGALGGDCPASVADQAMRSWCAESPARAANPACKCVLRSQQDDWQHFASLSGRNPGCWYVPCAGGMVPGGTLVEYGVRHAMDTQNCPSVCQTVIDLYHSGNVTLNDVTMTTTCDPGSKPPDPAVVDDGSKYIKWAAFGVAGAALAACVGLGMYVLLKKKRVDVL
jgi:hypothetical protein